MDINKNLGPQQVIELAQVIHHSLPEYVQETMFLVPDTYTQKWKVEGAPQHPKSLNIFTSIVMGVITEGKVILNFEKQPKQVPLVAHSPVRTSDDMSHVFAYLKSHLAPFFEKFCHLDIRTEPAQEPGIHNLVVVLVKK